MSDQAAAFFSGAKDVGLDLRQPPPDLGHQVVTVESVRFHQGISGPGVIVEVIQDGGGDHRGWRIQLGGKFPQYGMRDTKILVAALEGFGLDDPRAAAIGQAEIAKYLAAANPAKGRRIAIDTTESAKIDPKTGKPYRSVRPFAVTGASPAPAASPTPPASAAPAPAPAPVKAGPPAGWLENPNAPGWYYNPADTSAAQVRA